MLKMQIIRPPSLPPPEIPTPPHPLPKSGPDGRLPVVRINHPGYSPPNDALITIPAVDPLPQAQSGQGQEEHQAASRQERREQAGDIEVDSGLHHGTILTICGIIADNAFERVFLSYDHEGRSRVDARLHCDAILPAGEYWLQVGVSGAGSSQVGSREETPGQAGGPAQASEETMPLPRRTSAPQLRPIYPIVPNFENWRFPHKRLPSSWLKTHEPPAATPAPSISNSIAQRLRTLQPPHTTCIISAHGAAIEQAHIVPKACTEWFAHNDMNRYNNPSPLQADHIDQALNKISLRSDLHNLFDATFLTIIPKPVFVQPPSPPSSSSGNPTTAGVSTPRVPSQDGPQYALSVHVLSTPMVELIPLYHNLALRYPGLGPVAGPSQQYLGSREFLFARFAWSIFKLVQGFLDTERWVVVRSSSQQNQSSSTAVYDHKWASNASLAPRASGRGLSKRPASDIAQDAEYIDQPDRSKRRRYAPVRRTAEDLLNSGEELNDDELFQLDESQLLMYETMRRRADRSEESLGGNSEEPREVDCVDSQSEVERWRSQTCGVD